MPGIHDLVAEDVDGRDEPGHDQQQYPRHFRDGPKDQTRNLEIPGSRFARPGMTQERKPTMSTTTHAPKEIDPSASLHAEALGRAKSHGRLMGRRIIVVGAGQRTIVDEDPPIGNGRAMSVLFAREGAIVACIDVNKEAADATVGQITSEGAGIHGYADGPRRQPKACRPRHHSAVRPSGHRLGGRLCCAVSDFE